MTNATEATATTPVITHDEELALHVYLQQAEDLSRLIRLTSGGRLTLAVAENVHVANSVKDRARLIHGPEYLDAHDYASRLGGHSVKMQEFTEKIMALRARENQAGE